MAQRQFRSDDTSKWNDGFGNGSAGVLSQNTATDTTANTTLTGSLSSFSASVSSGTGFNNGDLVLIHPTQGNGAIGWELNKIASGGGTASWTLGYPLTNTYVGGAQVYKLSPYATAAINSGQTFSSSLWGGSVGGVLAILANQYITVSGNILGSARGYRGGTGGSGGSRQGRQGESNAGGGGAAQGANGAGGGGGTPDTALGDGGAGGGGGGHATAGLAGHNNNNGANGTGGAAGNINGTADLTIMFLGGAGGQGGVDDSGNPNIGGNGGAIIILIAPIITITGSIAVNGANGVNNGISGSSGGGAGGSVLLKGQIINVGTNLITATAGTGGAPYDHDGQGGDGSVGRIHADYLVSVTGTASPAIDTRQDSGLLIPSSMFFMF